MPLDEIMGVQYRTSEIYVYEVRMTLTISAGWSLLVCISLVLGSLMHNASGPVVSSTDMM